MCRRKEQHAWWCNCFVRAPLVCVRIEWEWFGCFNVCDSHRQLKKRILSSCPSRDFDGTSICSIWLLHPPKKSPARDPQNWPRRRVAPVIGAQIRPDFLLSNFLLVSCCVLLPLEPKELARCQQRSLHAGPLLTVAAYSTRRRVSKSGARDAAWHL